MYVKLHVCVYSCMYVYKYSTRLPTVHVRRYTLYHVAFLFQVSIHDSSSSIKLIELSASNFSASHMHSRSLLKIFIQTMAMYSTPGVYIEGQK
jgi:hypothetical protein